MCTGKCRSRIVGPILMVFGLVLSPAGVAAAQREGAQALRTTSEDSDPEPTFDDRGIEAFFDGILSGQMQTYRVAGATMAIVKDGRILLAKGYGFADIDAGKPVLPDQTLFRPGSVSKLFTWTAVMQLVEQGKLDLEADINGYLTDFRIPETYPQPVTLKHILSHTAGFEDGAVGYLFVRRPEDLVSLGKSLADHIPARVRPPGQLASYSNWGSALAGHVVANVSGQPFEHYIEEHIFKPLGMAHSTFREPLPDHLAQNMSVGYRYEKGWFTAKEFEYIHNFGPAGALSSTAVDMGNFMIAHLQKGRFGDTRILSQQTAELMHSRLFVHHPGVTGMAHGFYEMYNNGRRLIGHGGDTMWFHTLLALLPEENAGLFLSVNTAGASIPTLGIRDAVLRAYMDRYFPPLEAGQASGTGGLDPASVAGKYRLARHSYSRLEKISLLIQGDITIQPVSDGRILVSTPLGTQQFTPLEGDVFQEIGTDTRLAFGRDAAGEVTHAYYDPIPFIGLYRVSGYQTADFHRVLLAVCLVLFAGRLWGVFRRFRGARKEDDPQARRAGRVLTLSCLLFVLFVGVTVGVFSRTDSSEVVYGWPDGLSAALGLALLGAPLGLYALVMTVPVWTKGFWTLSARVRYTVVTLATVAFTLSLYYWNALGWYL